MNGMWASPAWQRGSADGETNYHRGHGGKSLHTSGLDAWGRHRLHPGL